MSAHLTPLKKQIQERVVTPTDRARLHPDSGVAHLSNGHFKYTPGTTNAEASNFWDGLRNFFVGLEEKIFHFDGLKQDEIIVDVVARTPQGNALIPNIRLNLNGYDSKTGDELRTGLKDLQPLQVKIVYDGGRVTECTPISWVFDHPSAQKIAGESQRTQGKFTPATGGGWGGLIGEHSTDDGSAGLSSLGNPKGSKAQFISDHGVVRQYQVLINAAAAAFGTDGNLIAAQIMVESHGNPNAMSGVGAKGLMQLMDGTFKDAFAKVNSRYPQLHLKHDPFNVTTNIMCGAYYQSYMLDLYAGDIKKAMAAYNYGMGNFSHVSENISATPQETRNYVERVITYWGQFTARSQKLALSKMNQRPEVSKIDKTHGTAQTANATAGGGTA